MYLQHARDALRSVIEYTKDGQSAFAASKMVQDAVLRNLEVLGEAVKAISAETRSLAPDVQWRRIAGMRDVLIHQYFGVDLDVVWGVVENEVPRLLTTVDQLILRLAADGP